MTNEIHEKKDTTTLPTPSKPSKMSESPNQNYINDLPGVKEIDLPESGSLGKNPPNEMNERSKETEKPVVTKETADADFTQKLPTNDHSADQY